MIVFDAAFTNRRGRPRLVGVPLLDRADERPREPRETQMNQLNARVLAAEFAGTFMFMGSVLAAAVYAFATPADGAGIVGVALANGFAVMAMAFAVGHISGAHFNPAVTLGLIAGGRIPSHVAVGYIAAQCAGALAACALFSLAGRTPTAFAANGYGELSMLKAGLVPVFAVEALLTGFLVFIIMGITHRRAHASFAPVAMGGALVAIHIMAIPISNASVNPARSLASALFSGSGEALNQLWLFWVAPIVGAVAGGLFARWLQEE
jgi:aquaporin Z